MYTVALAGNPNVGKSTIFNALTGMRQHTGNWPGKTVAVARGVCRWDGEEYLVTDLPGTYALRGSSPEEEIAAAHLRNEDPDCVAVILDATALERTLILALEILCRADRVVFCVNLMDEAAARGLSVDPGVLQKALGVPVVLTSARKPETLRQLKNAVAAMCREGPDQSAPALPGDPDKRRILAKELAELCCRGELSRRRELRADRILLGRYTAYPILGLLLLGIFWLTIQGANGPSDCLSAWFGALGRLLRRWTSAWPVRLRSLLLDGVYGTVTRVIAVMLPPMAIFFPLFTLLEDLGYLPRAAFLLDRPCAACGTCGKQALTMCMGFGCNAVGVTGCRILDTPEQRRMAILTNSFLPCNGRFPTLILLFGFLTRHAGPVGTLEQALLLTGFVLLAVGMSFLCTRLLHQTICRKKEGSFVLELPPYRRPAWKKILVRSVLDRTLAVLGRAVVTAAPAGLLIWILSGTQVNGTSLLSRLAAALEPAAAVLGLSGALLLAFILGFPANELVLPLAVLILSGGTAVGADPSVRQIRGVLAEAGMGWKEAICACLFCLFHWPCGTTILTVWRETGRLLDTLLAILLPTVIGAALCVLAHGILGWIR